MDCPKFTSEFSGPGARTDVISTDPSCLPQLIPLLNKLLSSPSAITLGPALSAFCEICPDRLDLLHPHYRHICRLLLDTDEWAQVVALSVLTRYARSMLEKPDNAGPVRPDAIVQPSKTQVNGEATDDEDDLGMDIDLAMLLHFALPLFQSRNAAVILATAATYYHLAPAGHAEVGQEKMVDPLLRLAGAQGAGAEASAIVWEVIAAMASERPVSSTQSRLPKLKIFLSVAIRSQPSKLFLARHRHAQDSANETEHPHKAHHTFDRGSVTSRTETICSFPSRRHLCHRDPSNWSMCPSPAICRTGWLDESHASFAKQARFVGFNCRHRIEICDPVEWHRGSAGETRCQARQTIRRRDER